MAPAIALAACCFIVGSDVAFSSYRNVMRASGRWIHVPRNVTTHCEVFVHRENQICFHDRFLSKAGYGRSAKCTARGLVFTVQKLRETVAVVSLIVNHYRYRIFLRFSRRADYCILANQSAKNARSLASNAEPASCGDCMLCP